MKFAGATAVTSPGYRRLRSSQALLRCAICLVTYFGLAFAFRRRRVTSELKSSARSGQSSWKMDEQAHSREAFSLSWKISFASFGNFVGRSANDQPTITTYAGSRERPTRIEIKTAKSALRRTLYAVMSVQTRRTFNYLSSTAA